MVLKSLQMNCKYLKRKYLAALEWLFQFGIRLYWRFCSHQAIYKYLSGICEVLITPLKY